MKEKKKQLLDEYCENFDIVLAGEGNLDHAALLLDVINGTSLKEVKDQVRGEAGK